MSNDLQIQSLIGELKGKKLQYICRSCELVDIGFGDEVFRKTASGKDITVPEYSLHLLCPFRIVRAQEILLGSDDLFTPIDGSGTVNLSVKNSSAFDVKAKEAEALLKSECVSEACVNEFGDLKFALSSFTICAFNSSSDENEAWRLIKSGENSIHLVRYGNEFEVQL